MGSQPPLDRSQHQRVKVQICLTGLAGIAKLLAVDCEVLEKTGLCCHFDGVIGPEAERIAAGVAV
jgi:hypothetical protein